MNRLKIIVPAAFALLALLPSCKDDDDSTEAVYLSGTLTLNQKFPAYTTNGDSFTFTPSGVTRKDEDTSTDCIGYYYYTSLDSTKDTLRYEGGDASYDGTFTYTIPDDVLGELTLYYVAYASGYSTKSITTKTLVVNPSLSGNGTITGLEEINKLIKSTMQDKSGNSYLCRNIDGTEWMVQNMADQASGHPYEEASLMGSIYGVYYTWQEACEVCPEGWRLPTSADWDALNEKYGAAGVMADTYYEGEKMWEYWPSVKISNLSSLSIMPTGYAMVSDSGYSYVGINDYAMFWTSDESGEDADFAIARYIYENNEEILAGAYDKAGIAASVRCVR